MNTSFNPLREVSSKSNFQKGDFLVVIGEIFQRGYVNGLLDQAQKLGMECIFTTVGRRDASGDLQQLTEEELGGRNNLINIPLEAGFDMEKSSSGKSPVDQLSGLKLKDWQETRLDWSAIESSRQLGILRFQKNLTALFLELEKRIPKDRNVLFVHTMAGGVPRAKIIMPLMNRVFKGREERYLASNTFWDSELGKLCQMSFREVTAMTFEYLLLAAEAFRKTRTAAGKKVSFIAYGYHGTEILHNGRYQWQSYAPYLQGWAKMDLEMISKKATERGLTTCVFNCPEILTNSSSIFQGVEVPLYPLLMALRKERPHSHKVQKMIQECEKKLNHTEDLKRIFELTERYYSSDEISRMNEFSHWPEHSTETQLSLLLATSEAILDCHKDSKDLITFNLSECVLESCGYIMLHEAGEPRAPVAWIGHDLVAKVMDLC